jgi:hypothetical protein
MIEMNKYVLDKVSFDKVLFQKELVKAIKVLEKNDRIQLRTWCQDNFGQYSGILHQVFNNHVPEQED